MLRTDAAARLAVSLDRVAEFRCIEAAHKAGVKVAEPIAVCGDAELIGAPFAIQALVAGTAQGRRIVRDPELRELRRCAGARASARELARIHAIRPADGVLPFLPVPIGNPSRRAVVAELRAGLDRASEPRPALEYILVLARPHAPEPEGHHARRTAISAPATTWSSGGRLTAMLDWEFCHWGDPREDIGWFIARCWRFGNDDKVAGGIAKLALAARGLQRCCGHQKVTAPEMQYFEVLAAARWAAISLLQGDRFVKGGERSIELALTGLMPPEMEFDALDIIEQARQGPRIHDRHRQGCRRRCSISSSRR